MQTNNNTKALLDTYYKGLAQKSSGWETVLTDNFTFIGGDMTKPEPVIGKQAYIEVVKRFSQVFTALRIKQRVIEGNSACVIANYDYMFPNGKAMSGNVAEIWQAENGKLCSLTLFFDTLTFKQNITK